MGARRLSRATFLALVAILVIGSVPVTDDGVSLVTIRDAEGGALLASAPLPVDGTMALRYRNSLYGSLAEERFVITDDGALKLVQLAADELAVLEEYYAIDTPAWRATEDDRRAWLAEPAAAMTTDQLRIAATDLGERTLMVEGEPPLPLWELPGADPTVVLGVEYLVSCPADRARISTALVAPGCVLVLDEQPVRLRPASLPATTIARRNSKRIHRTGHRTPIGY